MSNLMSPSLDDLNFTPEEMDTLIKQGFEDEAQILRASTPHTIGPTWSVDDEGDWILPEYTLGWQIAAWCADYLIGVDDGPWRFSLEQLRFLLWWYACDDEGNFIYRTGVLQRCKGWGKDPLLAVICLVEFAGPSRVVGWDGDTPIGGSVREPVVIIAAVSQEQTKNTMDLIPSLMSDKFKSVYGVLPGLERIRGRVGGRLAQILAVSSNYRTIEGKRSTFALLNETHHWHEANGGVDMHKTIHGNASKMNARYLAITNAYMPGEDSVAERMRTAWEEGLEEDGSNATDFLYDSVEADATAPLAGPLVPRLLERIRGDSVWLKTDAIISAITNRSIPVEHSRRMYLNQIWAGSDSLHDPKTWGALEDERLTNLRMEHGPHAGLRDGDEVVMGFDGSKSRDATALVVIRVRDAAVFMYGLWEPPTAIRSKADEDWEVNREEVDSLVAECFRRFDVAAFYADVALWESYIDKWTVEYGDGLQASALSGKPIAWDMRTSLKNSTLAHERLMDAIFGKRIIHNGDPRLRRHVLNTFRRENNFGVYFGKEARGSRRKIDAYAALMLAHEALVNYRQKDSAGKVKKKTQRRGFFF